jgi:hypothetical protein
MKTTREILRKPVQLAAVSAIGLMAALVSDGVGDAVAWLCLAYVVGVAGRHAITGIRAQPKR